MKEAWMSIDPKSPLTIIEGIGPAIATRLEELNLYYVFDLVRATVKQIHEAVQDLASLEEARGWRAMALFLQIRGMTAQWAEALVRGGIVTIEEIVQRSQSDLATVFAEAKEASAIPQVPSPEELFEMRIDATRLSCTGSMNGTVRDLDGNPLPGVEARIGTQRAMTDERGRFRLTRVQLGGPQRLILKHADYATLTVEAPPLTFNDDEIGVSIYTLTALVAAPTPVARLSEYGGDVLPAMSQFALSTRSLSAAELRDRDILVLHRFYEGGNDAHLTSKFLEYEDGIFYAVSFKVPVAALPPQPQEKDIFIHKRGTFVRIRLNATRLACFKRLRRVRKELTGRPRLQTLMELDQVMREIAACLRDT
jgi:predicted flap endonuclease-1-like 5' DNA nuclease